MIHDLPPVAEVTAADSAALDAAIAGARQPFVVRGLVADWPLVQAAKRSLREARAHLLAHARERDFAVSMGDPQAGGRLFYDADMQMNFRMGHGRLDKIFAGFDAAEDHDRVPTVYLASIDIEQFFDGLGNANPMPLSPRDAIGSIWIGTPTRIAAHNDFPDNLACCAAGKRRFTLFPPDQFRNLYLGPIDNTPAGRAVSMVDLAAPDLHIYPRFAEALGTAMVADLEPGDALYIPSLWYHHVEATAPFNVLVNYWWRDTPRFLGQPQNALNHAILAIRDLPQEQREIWRAMFDHYVFSGGAEAAAHIPPAAQGVLAPFDAQTAGRMHAFLLRSLSQ